MSKRRKVTRYRGEFFSLRGEPSTDSSAAADELFFTNLSWSVLPLDSFKKCCGTAFFARFLASAVIRVRMKCKAHETATPCGAASLKLNCDGYQCNPENAG
ncbi:MAG: hypothetical protein K9G83_11390, partial [Hyphomonadaceae bacterium]|nr:hypothetical protein [Hyphomonadaceae bacterium]